MIHHKLISQPEILETNPTKKAPVKQKCLAPLELFKTVLQCHFFFFLSDYNIKFKFPTTP